MALLLYLGSRNAYRIEGNFVRGKAEGSSALRRFLTIADPLKMPRRMRLGALVAISVDGVNRKYKRTTVRPSRCQATTSPIESVRLGDGAGIADVE